VIAGLKNPFPFVVSPPLGSIASLRRLDGPPSTEHHKEKGPARSPQSFVARLLSDNPPGGPPRERTGALSFSPRIRASVYQVLTTLSVIVPGHVVPSSVVWCLLFAGRRSPSPCPTRLSRSWTSFIQRFRFSAHTCCVFFFFFFFPDKGLLKPLCIAPSAQRYR